MKGKYYFRVKSKKTRFDFVIKRNITIIKGDSATGKTTLLHMLYEYLRVGRESGYSVSTDANFYVYLRKEVGRNWQEVLFPLENTIIFIEENNDFVFSEEFAEFVKNSGNYFVLINRSPFKMLPYSIHEIYEIVTEGKKADVKESYHEFKELYGNYPILENNIFQNVMTEDSNSGFQFFSKVFNNSNIVSANGNGNIINEIKKLHNGDTLIVADGAAFGSIMEECIEYFTANTNRRISIWLPESFEFLLLKSGIVQFENLEEILENTYDYLDCKEYESWERYFAALLISLTKDMPYEYTKSVLNDYYTRENVVDKILEHFPDEIKANISKCN